MDDTAMDGAAFAEAVVFLKHFDTQLAGFLTGPLGMGHAVLHVENVGALLPFYHNVLGFSVTDYGLTPYPLHFLHLNARHHSFAMVGSGRQGLHHFMVQLRSLDDVGQGYDLAQIEDGRVACTLGRHTNDHMTSFYAHAPGNFFVEYGWGARVIEPASWTAHETFDRPSLWGHERLYMDPEPRARLREMRLAAAARGMRATVPRLRLVAGGRPRMTGKLTGLRARPAMRPGSVVAPASPVRATRPQPVLQANTVVGRFASLPTRFQLAA